MESLAKQPIEPIRENELVIQPPTGWVSLDLREVWDSRELIYFLTKREIQVRYKQSYVGIGWAILQPLAMTIVFGIVFGLYARVETANIPYPVFALAGLAGWLFFANSLSQGAQTVVKDAPLVTKIYFPRVLLPLTKVLSLVLDLGIAMVFVVALGIVYGVGIQATLPVATGFLLLAFVSALAAAVFFAAANVPYRDVGVIVPLLVQIGLFATPVVYPISLVPEGWQDVYALNPMSSVVEGIRWALFGTPAPDVSFILISSLVAVLGLCFAYVYFKRVDRVLPDII
jgi:lipopolysaccharide transport system permease protein